MGESEHIIRLWEIGSKKVHLRFSENDAMKWKVNYLVDSYQASSALHLSSTSRELKILSNSQYLLLPSHKKIIQKKATWTPPFSSRYKSYRSIKSGHCFPSIQFQTKKGKGNDWLSCLLSSVRSVSSGTKSASICTPSSVAHFAKNNNNTIKCYGKWDNILGGGMEITLLHQLIVETVIYSCEDEKVLE